MKAGSFESISYFFWLLIDELLHSLDPWLDFEWRYRFCQWCHRKDVLL